MIKMVKSNITISEWTDAPSMDVGAPMPGILAIDGNLFVAYILSESFEENEVFGVVRFKGVMQHTFGYPNDEALGAHPLYESGLNFYSFNYIEGSPYIKELDERNSTIFPDSKGAYCRRFKHWVVTFHDETLEVIGSSVEFVGSGIAESAHDAISKIGQ